MLVLGTRVLAAACILLSAWGIAGMFADEHGDELFDLGTGWMLGWLALAGLLATLRFFPRADDPGHELVPAGAVERHARSLLVDLALVTVVPLVVAAVASAMSPRDDVDWLVPVGVAVLAAVAWILGAVAGLLVVLPLHVLATGVRRRLTGRPVALGSTIVAVAVLGVTAGIGVGAFAVAIDGPVPRILVPLVLVTGIEVPGVIEIVSQPLAWASRLLLVGTALVLWLGGRAERSELARRRRRPPGDEEPGDPRERAERDARRRRGRGGLAARRRYGDD